MKHYIEHITWQNYGYGKNTEFHATGFITKENKDFLILSLTCSHGKYIDLQKIKKNDIISREKIN